MTPTSCNNAFKRHLTQQLGLSTLNKVWVDRIAVFSWTEEKSSYFFKSVADFVPKKNVTHPIFENFSSISVVGYNETDCARILGSVADLAARDKGVLVSLNWLFRRTAL